METILGGSCGFESKKGELFAPISLEQQAEAEHRGSAKGCRRAQQKESSDRRPRLAKEKPSGSLSPGPQPRPQLWPQS